MVVEQADTECAPVRMGIKAGERYTRRDLLTALMVKSSNDIAQALARDNAGSLPAFVAKMNAKAKELGCTECRFINPNGLPPVDDQPDPYCTARDLAKIARVADKLPDLREMVKLKTYSFVKGDGKPMLLENTNRVLRTYEFCDGMKTGYTQAAGHCLVASGERDGRRRIVVVLNGSTTGVWKDAQALLEWALRM
jgi:D-alanyl-D-alanine carboxypeptidase (penicillin-binding protein 5/6)